MECVADVAQCRAVGEDDLPVGTGPWKRLYAERRAQEYADGGGLGVRAVADLGLWCSLRNLGLELDEKLHWLLGFVHSTCHRSWSYSLMCSRRSRSGRGARPAPVSRVAGSTASSRGLDLFHR